MSKTRSSNFELLRIISIIFIMMMHGYAQIKQPYSGATELSGVLINAVGNTGVTLFVLISGYFSIKFKAQRFVQLAILTTAYNFFVCLVNGNFCINGELLKSLAVVPLYKNWFIACYMVLMVLSPWINDFINKMSEIRFRQFLLVGFFFLSLIPTIFNSAWESVLSGGG